METLKNSIETLSITPPNTLLILLALAIVALAVKWSCFCEQVCG